MAKFFALLGEEQIIYEQVQKKTALRNHEKGLVAVVASGEQLLHVARFCAQSTTTTAEDPIQSAIRFMSSFEFCETKNTFYQSPVPIAP